MVSDMWEVLSVFVVSLLLAYPLGGYLATILQDKPMKGDGLFKWVEKPIYALMGVKHIGMNWKQYL